MASVDQIKLVKEGDNSLSYPLVGLFDWCGELGLFAWRALVTAFTSRFSFRDFVRQLDEVGARSVPLVALAGSAIGAVLAMEARQSLTRFGAKSLLPSAIVFAVIIEMSPIVTGLVVSGRVGAGIGAELAAMEVTEQIDAIEASAVDPYRVLAVPRIAACIVALPLLTLVASFCGVLMGWVAVTLTEPITLARFIDIGFKGAGFQNLLPPTLKTAVYGMIIGTVASFQGMRAKGGAQGVGNAATTAVVLSSLLVILADVFLVKLIVLIFP
jgi:phospholipid/cholesterol/gamma-HCH transport system permease protein